MNRGICVESESTKNPAGKTTAENSFDTVFKQTYQIS